MRASARLFDAAIGKRGKQDVQVINEQFLRMWRLSAKADGRFFFWEVVSRDVGLMT